MDIKETKSPETDTTDHHQTGDGRIQSAKPLNFTNGGSKRHQTQPQHRHHHHHHPIVVTYKECLKNHAASSGGLAVDGCGEFMPSPTATPSDPTSFKCAACGCHRNFHRREPDQDHHHPHPHAHTPRTATIEYQPHHRHHPPQPPPPTHPPNPQSQRSPSSASPPPISSSYYPSAPHMLLALSGNLHQQSSAAVAAVPHHEYGNNYINSSVGVGRKRFRTKFSESQKKKMYEFAERVGWKMQKRDEDLVNELCNQVGVDRTVFKVWMHNNKNTFAKRDLNGGTASANAGIGRINNLVDHKTGNNNSSSSSKNGDGDDHDEDHGVQNLNHPFESVANANGGGGGSSSSS